MADRIAPDFHQVNLDIEGFIKGELGIKLDKDDQICRLALTPSGCPLGAQSCPLRHTTPSHLNFIPPPPQPHHPRDRERLNTVCKHWLRGLCKKGDQCEFLHEYNLRKMPECYWLGKYGYCPGGDECLYYHPREKKRVCEDYKRGFCWLGPTCPRSHIPLQLCTLYASGFCPFGPSCTSGHPKDDLPPLSAYRPPTPPLSEAPGPPPPGYGRYSEFDPKTIGTHTGGGGGGGGGERDNSSVLCFKCNQKGHYACPNGNVPGQRGGPN
ncbi:hypothetical protein BDY24DRAFT_340768 [Mrakia frigida]|uniref:uncharacterized protein n=1 Tax=Mrakia frigida TaxID=29902 RepID=UPI003FCBF64C